eukprot:scaffold12533_cov24-Tisochrysis_lutea.AAC.1
MKKRRARHRHPHPLQLPLPDPDLGLRMIKKKGASTGKQPSIVKAAAEPPLPLLLLPPSVT